MSETLMQRAGRLVSGAAHHIIDAAEDLAPEATMEQAIREIDRGIQEMQAEHGAATARRHLAQTRLHEENARHQDLEEQCDIALAEGRRDLAETGMGQILDIEAQIPVLENQIETAERERTEIAGYISALKGRRSEMRDELRRLRESQAQAARAGSAPGSATGHPGGDIAARASEAFERTMERTAGMAGHRESPNAQEAQDLEELDALKRRHRIEERLRARQSTD